MKRVYFIFVLIFALIGAAPLFSNSGFLTTRAGGDSPFNLFRLHQLYTVLGDGVFPVRWMPDAAFGLGYPFFNFYAALPYYFAAFFKAYGFSYVLSLKVVVLLGFIIAATGMYGWIQGITKRPAAALLASAAYTFAPYHLVNIYVRGDSLSEFWAMAWYPMIFWAMHHASEHPTKRNLAGVALAYGALVMTHNISALIFSPYVALYGVVLVLQAKKRLKMLFSIGGAGILGLMLATWFWIPALTEQDTVQLEDQTTGYFFYGNHFREANLIQTTFTHDYNAIGIEANPFSMGLMQAILIGLGLIALIFVLIKQRNFWRDGFLLFGLLFSTFMITPHSEKLWEVLPLLELVQFPWRFLAIQAFFGAAVIGFIPYVLIGARAYESLYLKTRLSRHHLPFFNFFPHTSTMGWGLLISAGLSLILAYTALGNLTVDFMPMRDADVTPERLHWYESFTGNLGTTIRAEYLPIAATPRPYTSDYLLQREPIPKFIGGTGNGQLLSRHSNQQTWEIMVESETSQIALPLLYWSGWKVFAGGEAIEASGLEGLGYLQFNLPQGQHTVEVKFTHTPRRFFAETISLAAVIILLLMLRPQKISRQHTERAVVLLIPIILLGIVLRLLPSKFDDDSQIISADFAQASYFHPNQVGIPYENGMVLRDAIYQLDETRFTYDFTWQHDNPAVTKRLDIASPLPVYFLGAPMFNVETGTEITGEREIPFLTPGLYFPRILLFNEGSAATQDTPRISPLTNHDVGRGDIYLAPVIVQPQSSVEENLEQTITLGSLKILDATTRADEEYLQVVLLWQALAEVPMNYGIDFQLLDTNGTQWARFNALMGGAGMYPTGLWRTGEIIPDNYRLPLPYGIPTGHYTLHINLYNPITLESLNQAEIPNVEQTYVSEYGCPLPQSSVYHDRLRVNELNFPSQVSDVLPIDIVWSVATAPQENYQLEWTLRSGEEIVWETRTPLAPGSDATTWQTDSECGAYVLAHHRLNLPRTLTAGSYTLTMQLFSEDGDPLVEPHSPGTVEIIQ